MQDCYRILLIYQLIKPRRTAAIMLDYITSNMELYQQRIFILVKLFRTQHYYGVRLAFFRLFICLCSTVMPGYSCRFSIVKVCSPCIYVRMYSGGGVKSGYTSHTKPALFVSWITPVSVYVLGGGVKSGYTSHTKPALFVSRLTPVPEYIYTHNIFK